MPNAPQTHRPAGYVPPAQREKQWASRTQGHREWYRSAEWKAIRAEALLRDNRLCQECLRNGITKPLGKHAQADHITPHKWDRELFFDINNVQSLCQECHSRKTAREDGGFGNRPRGVG